MLQKARERAGQLGISLAEYVRRLVAEDLGGGVEPVGPTAVFNLGSSGGSDVARDKDAMLGQAFSEKAHRKEDRFEEDRLADGGEAER